MQESDLYIGREQTLVKHFILRKYLERFAHIVGSYKDVITYVDCFSGPWNVKSEDLKDSSFCIALDELRKARETQRARGRNLRLRCFFLEKNPQAYSKLKEFADRVEDVQIETRNSELEDVVEDIISFIKEGGFHSFPFIFIDPKGWTGFAMDSIASLLRIEPGEVLINFMTGHIRRFIDSPQEITQESFIRLFGSPNFKDRIQGLEKQDREEAVVLEYSENVKKVGGFKYTSSAIVLHPEIDRTHFHLIYATRHAKGVEVFKEAEKKAMEIMEEARAEAHQRRREARTHQAELFNSRVLHDSTHYDFLRERALSRSKEAVMNLLQSNKRAPYDDIWALALRVPLIWESDLKGWIKDWAKESLLVIEGLKPNQRVPRRNEGNVLVWQR